MKTLEEANALWVIGILPMQELPQIACDALAAGIDTPALRDLAGLTLYDATDGATLFERVLRELKYSRLSMLDALKYYIMLISKRIIQGEISPEKGAQDIWDAAVKANIYGFHDADAFIYAASEMKSRPEDSGFFLIEIVKEAHRWIAKNDK